MKISLSAARRNANLRQTDVSVALGISPCTIGNWESGKTDITARMFLKLCDLYGVKAEDISLPCELTVN